MANLPFPYSNNRVNQAGSRLASDTAGPDDLVVIDELRRVHSQPLHLVTSKLQQRVKLLNKAFAISRIKRLPSLAVKLRQSPTMKLARMQDIGGCRAVVQGSDDLKWLALQYRADMLRGADQNAIECFKEHDYVSNPKADGYRSIHFIVNCPDAESGVKRTIEVQMRTSLQHAWATSVEAYQFFTKQSVKTQIKDADPFWLRFFELMGNELAYVEGHALEASMPPTVGEWREELKAIDHEHGCINRLLAWGATIQGTTLAKSASPDTLYVLELNTRNHSVTEDRFHPQFVSQAHDLYIERERATAHDDATHVVLVSAATLADLKSGFPSFFADVHAFVIQVTNAIGSA